MLGVFSRRASASSRSSAYNAQWLVLHDPARQLEYVEGIGVGPASFPVHHGWATLNGKVIDLTFRTHKPNHKGRLRNRIFGEFPKRGATSVPPWTGRRAASVS